MVVGGGWVVLTLNGFEHLFRAKLNKSCNAPDTEHQYGVRLVFFWHCNGGGCKNWSETLYC